MVATSADLPLSEEGKPTDVGVRSETNAILAQLGGDDDLFSDKAAKAKAKLDAKAQAAYAKEQDAIVHRTDEAPTA